MQLLWEDSLVLKGEDEIRRFFEGSKRRLFVLAKGFDPRMCWGLRTMHEITDMDVALMVYSETPKSSSHDYASDSEVNMQEFYGLCQNVSVKEIRFPMWREEEGRKTSLVKKHIEENFKRDYLQEYEEIIIDMSAMPRSIYTVLIKTVYKRRGNAKLFIIVCENSTLDDSIFPTNTFEEVTYLNGIGTYSIGSEQDANKNVVWFPMLGTGTEESIKKIADFLQPNEICPIVPFPSLDPARSDRILQKYKEVLFQRLEIEMKNIIYVSEFNPLLVYKKICMTVSYYAEALSILNRNDNPKETKFIFSMQSSKLMEIGLLFAILDLMKNKYKVGIAVIENEGYEMDKKRYEQKNNRLCCVCLDQDVFEWTELIHEKKC